MAHYYANSLKLFNFAVKDLGVLTRRRSNETQVDLKLISVSQVGLSCQVDLRFHVNRSMFQFGCNEFSKTSVNGFPLVPLAIKTIIMASLQILTLFHFKAVRSSWLTFNQVLIYSLPSENVQRWYAKLEPV